MYKKFKTYIIGDALANAKDIFEQSKIELAYTLSVSFILLYTLMIVNIGQLNASFAFEFVHYASYLCFISMLFILRITKSAFWVSISFWTTGAFVTTSMLFVASGQISTSPIAWHYFGIIACFLMLPRKGAFFGALYFITITLLLFLSHINDWSIFDVGLTMGIENMNDPVATLIPIVAGTYMLWYFLKTKNKAQNLIVLQKETIESSHKELIDSINYAKRIQSAILPSPKLVQEHLPNSFILYKPKDVVAGDFYWIEPSKEGVLFAAADCTGHGVPGAMVSVVCNNALNRSVREYGLTEPGKILDKTREIIIKEFEKSEEEVKDGMDIALCSLKGNQLQYAGAHNPLWVVRNNEIIEIRANKQPIGKFDKPLPYKTNSIELEKGDTIYIFSDGFVDQFGGEKGKKFKAANLKKLILSAQNKSIVHQHELFDNAFENWKGKLEQLDDVCLIGVKIE